MLKKNNKVLSLEMALRAAVYSDADQSIIADIAEKNCWNVTTFRNSLCPTNKTHKANIHHLEAVLSETRDAGIMDAICAIHGKAGWFELPDFDHFNEISYLRKIGELAKEEGDLATSIANAVLDNKITKQEEDQIYKDVLDLVRVATSILAMIKRHREVS